MARSRQRCWKILPREYLTLWLLQNSIILIYAFRSWVPKSYMASKSQHFMDFFTIVFAESLFRIFFFSLKTIGCKNYLIFNSMRNICSHRKWQFFLNFDLFRFSSYVDKVNEKWFHNLRKKKRINLWKTGCEKNLTLYFLWQRCQSESKWCW